MAYDTSVAAGSDPACTQLLADAFDFVIELSGDPDGRATLEEAFGLCPGTLTPDDSDGYRLQVC